MLEKLNDIAWEELKTSFGESAQGLDKLIRDLASDSEDKRYWAYEHLRWLIHNEHLVGTATLAAIPFFIELLESDVVQEKHYILWLIADSFQFSEANPKELEKKPRKKLEVRVRQAISKGLDVYIELSKHPDMEVRHAAISLIARKPFPKRFWGQIEEVYQEIKKRETHPEIQQYFEQWDKYRSQYRVSEKNTENKEEVSNKKDE